jgi:CRP-like cAMP-binding protein
MSDYDQAVFEMYLAQVPMFGACSEDERRQVSRFASPRSADRGDALVREGEAGDEFFVIMMGQATVTRRDQELATLDPGDYFGELALFDPAPRNATVTAAVPVTVAVLARDAFQRALDAVPTMRDALLRGMARRIHDLDAKV